MFTVRLLDPAEWPQLLTLGVEPFATHGLPDGAHWLIVGAFEGETLVGISGLYETVHNDPWWIAPAYRRSPTLVRELWQGMQGVLESRGVETIHITVADALPEVQAMVERLGFHPAPGVLYVVHLPDAILSRKE